METYRGIAKQWECDHMGHMNVQFYMDKFDTATWQFFSMMKLSAQYLKSNNRGMAALEQNIIYKKEIMPGETLYIKTDILEAKKKTIKFKHTMIKGETGEIATEFIAVAIHMDTIIRKSCEFEPEIYQNILNMMNQ